MGALSADLRSVACQLNGYFAARLGLPPPFARLAGSPQALLEAVVTLQTDSAELVADGILGPKTRAYLRGELQTATEPCGGYLIVAGERCATPFATVCFDVPQGLSFLGQPGWQLRAAPGGDGVNLCVLHWDECISSTHCFGVLLARGLSVHLMLDADGMVYQALDLAAACAYHARIHNERSVGIEIQNSFLPCAPRHPRLLRRLTQQPLPHTVEPFVHLEFTQAQRRVVAQLVPWLCETLNIVKQLPTDADGQVYCSTCPQPFYGVCGHYHLQTDKVDPGPSLWAELGPLLHGAKQRADTATR